MNAGVYGGYDLVPTRGTKPKRVRDTSSTPELVFTT
jgi:hypothetical protein